MCGLANSGVAIWDTESGVLQTELSTPSRVRCVAWSADDRWIAAADYAGGVALWNAKTHEAISGIQAGADEVYSVVFSKDGGLLYVGRGLEYEKTYTQEYDLEQFPLLAPRKIDGFRIQDIAHDGERLLGVRWGEVTVQQRATNRVIWSDTVTTGSVSSVSFSGDDRRFVRGGNSDRTAEMWNIQTGQVEARIAHLAPVSSVACGPLSRYWATGSEDGVVSIWRNEARAALRAEPFPLPIWRIALTDRDELFLGGPFPVEVRGPSSLEANCLNLSFSRDGKYLAACCEGNCIRVWELPSARVLPGFIIEGGAGKWAAIAQFSRDGKYLAGGNGSGVVRVWDVASGRELSRFTTGIGEIHSLDFFPDSRRLAVAGVGPISLWDIQTGQELLSLPVPDYKIYQVIVSSDGRTLVACSDAGVVRRWQSGGN